MGGAPAILASKALAVGFLRRGDLRCGEANDGAAALLLVPFLAVGAGAAFVDTLSVVAGAGAGGTFEAAEEAAFVVVSAALFLPV